MNETFLNGRLLERADDTTRTVTLYDETGAITDTRPWRGPAMQAESWISIIVAGLALAGVIYTGWSSRRQSAAEGTKSPYEALATRVAQLEESDRAKHAEIQRLRRAVDGRDDIIHALVEFVDDLGAWLHGGQRGKAPRPSDGLHDYIRSSYWHTDPDGIPDDGQPFNPELRT